MVLKERISALFIYPDAVIDPTADILPLISSATSVRNVSSSEMLTSDWQLALNFQPACVQLDSRSAALA